MTPERLAEIVRACEGGPVPKEHYDRQELRDAVAQLAAEMREFKLRVWKATQELEASAKPFDTACARLRKITHPNV